MFTIKQISIALAKVKTGADYPAYVREIIQLGVKSYETHVIDGQTDYYGTNNEKVSSYAKYANLSISAITDPAQFKADLLAHQQGKTNFPTFVSDCAKSGIERWAVSTDKMTCTYYDQSGREILLEKIPS